MQQYFSSVLISAMFMGWYCSVLEVRMRIQYSNYCPQSFCVHLRVSSESEAHTLQLATSMASTHTTGTIGEFQLESETIAKGWHYFLKWIALPTKRKLAGY